MKNLSSHEELVCDLVTSLLMRGIQLGGTYKLVWVFGLIKHVVWADYLYVLYPLRLWIFKIVS
jgi:hypothetical protein